MRKVKETRTSFSTNFFEGEISRVPPKLEFLLHQNNIEALERRIPRNICSFNLRQRESFFPPPKYALENLSCIRLSLQSRRGIYWLKGSQFQPCVFCVKKSNFEEFGTTVVETSVFCLQVLCERNNYFCSWISFPSPLYNSFQEMIILEFLRRSVSRCNVVGNHPLFLAKRCAFESNPSVPL